MNNKTEFIAIVGKPNVGKSSLLNRILGKKVSIVSKKPQTTRTRIMGVYTQNEIQLVFIDTPGLHKPRTNLGEYMVKSVRESINGVDTCLLVVNTGEEILSSDIEFMDKFKISKIPAVLAINKIDLALDKSYIIKQIKEYSKRFNFEAIIPLSAKTGDGVDELIDELKKLAIPSEHFFDSDALTDQPERVVASEIIREKILRLTDKEIPHGTAVIVERMQERQDKPEITDIDAVIYCEKNSHKGIIIGKNGSMLKKIGSYARRDMESFFACKINLNIWVKVKEDWRNRESVLRSLGYDNKNFSEE